MVKLIHDLSQLTSKKILLAGDLMLDRYTFGKAGRISPEAPVPVLLVEREHSLPGGAGNVALGLKALNQKVVLLGRVGDDSAGEHLKAVLEERGIASDDLVVEANYTTPVKNRLIADRQQMLRIDREKSRPLDAETERLVIERIPSLLEGVSLVALSDYAKGFLTEGLIQALIKEAKKRDILVVIDPKGLDFYKYRGAYLIKPNLKEAYLAAKAPSDLPLSQVARIILEETGVDKLLVTRSEEGVSIFDKETQKDFPVQVKEVVDVTGAGDTVLAMIASAIASNLPVETAALLANTAASLALEHVGCCQITLKEISTRLLDQHAEDKMIESVHRPALEFALKDRPHTIFELKDERTLSPDLYEKISKLKTLSEHTIVLNVEAFDHSEAFVRMLASLKEVDFILKK